MIWTDSLFRRWARTRPPLRADKPGRYRPTVELLEDREVPATGITFLQGYAFVDANRDGIYDAGDTAKVGATIQLTRTNFEALTATTDGNGFYRFTELTPGATYTLTETDPVGYTPEQALASALLSQVNSTGTDSVTVTLGTDPGGLTFNRNGGPIAANVPGTAYTLAGGPLNQFTSNPSAGNSHQYQGFLSDSGTPLTANFLTYCVDLFHANPATYGVVTSDGPFIPASAGLPATSAENVGRIGYLYATYGRTAFTGTDAGVKEAALGLAFYELLYDATPDFGAGNFQIVSATPAAVVHAANDFLAQSAGKNYSVVFLNVPQPADSPPNFSGSQGMLATELFNFANVPPTVPPPPGSLAGTVFEDCNGNGAKDADESGIKGVTLTLNGPGGTRTATTDASGSYSFDNLTAGTYTLTETQPAGFLQGADTPGNPRNGTVSQTATADAVSGIVVNGRLSGFDFGERITPDALSLSLTKTADKAVYAPGETATYTYTVTNNSAVAVDGVNVVDDNATPGYAADDFTVASNLTLSAGESRTFTRAVPLPVPETDPATGTNVGQLLVTTLPSGDVQVTYLQNQLTTNDNRYGAGATAATGWPSGHKFNDLVGSDHAEFIFTNAAGGKVLDVFVDYISQATSATFPAGTVSYASGYGTLGVTGGDGKVLTGNAAWVLSATTSLTDNLKLYPTGFLINSPAETSPGSGVSAVAPRWNYTNSYTVVISKAAFGAAGFGGVSIGEVHNSPGKQIDRVTPTPGSATLTNTATATVTDCGATSTAKATATVQVQPPGGGQNCPPVHSGITSNFNGTDIKAGNTIWFNAVFDPGAVPTNQVTTISFTHAKITYTDSTSGTPVTRTISIPDALVTFDPQVIQATTRFNATMNRWETVAPTGIGGNVFLTGFAFLVPETIKGGAVKTITLEGDFAARSSANIDLKWKWAAAVYDTNQSPNLFADPNAVGVKPVDDAKASAYKNSDHAGTPEAAKWFVIGGARGGGGSNFTGSYSGTASVQLCPDSLVL